MNYFIFSFILFLFEITGSCDRAKTLPTRLVFFSLLPVAFAEDTQKAHSQQNFEKENEKKSTSGFSLFMESEGRLLKNQISKNQIDFYPYLSYAETGFQYSKNNTFKFLLNLEIESYENKWQAGMDEFSLSYLFETLPFEVKTGWLPLSLGYMNKNRNVFLRPLSIYNRLSYQDEDMGFIADLRIWREFFKIQAGHFGGWLYRESDDSFQAPKSGPWMLSLKSRGSFWDGFLSYFEADLAFFNPLKAYGAGLCLNIDYKKLSVDIQSEFWRILEKGQSSFAYYVFPNIQIHTLKVGMLFSSLNKFSPHLHRSFLYERVFQVSWQAHPHISLMGERFITTQKKGPFINDLWALRLKVHIEWSREL